MPSTNVFDTQNLYYKEKVLLSSVSKRVAIEAAHTDFWRKYVGLHGAVVGISCFGESAPSKVLLEHFDFTVEKVVNTENAL
jgi:transketolase